MSTQNSPTGHGATTITVSLHLDTTGIATDLEKAAEAFLDLAQKLRERPDLLADDEPQKPPRGKRR